jgi:peptide/nickel transport system substrate-binding protein
MRHIRWQLLIAIGGLILVVGLLLGQAPGSETGAPQPVRGGTYSEALVGSLGRLNPVLDYANQADRDIDRLIFSGLVRFDSRGLPTPDLAEGWSVSADATLYTVTIRSDAVWHDGEPVTADDVIYTYSKLQDPSYPGPADLAQMWQQIQVVRLDSRTIQFQLPEPFAPFFDYLALGLLPDHLLRGVSTADLIDHPYNLEPIGTGPFRFERYLIQDEEILGLSLTAFEDYYGDAPYLDRVEFRYYEDEAAALAAYQAGEVLGISSAGEAILPDALAIPTLNLHTAPLPRMTLVFLNLRNQERPFFADKKVRQALLLAINRQWIIDRFLGGQGTVAIGPIVSSSWAFSRGIEARPFAPEQAGALLDEAGWTLPAGAVPGTPEYVRSSDDVPLSFELLHLDDTLHTQIAQAIQVSWAANGVHVSLVPVDPESMLEAHLVPRDYEAVLTDINLTRSPDPDPYPFWHDSQAETGQNYGGFEDRNSSIWLEQARITPDFSKRADLYQSFQHRFNDQLPALPLVNPVYSFAIDASVQGVTVGPMLDPSDRFASINSWYLLVRRDLNAGGTDAP